MWSNPDLGCVQGSTNTSSPLPLSTVDLRQYSSSVSGSLGSGTRGVRVAASQGVDRRDRDIVCGVPLVRRTSKHGDRSGG